MNRTIFEFIFDLSRENSLLDASMIFVARYLPYVLVISFLIIVFMSFSDWRRRLACIVSAVLAVIVSRGIIAESFRFFYPSPRPFVDLGFEPLIQVSSHGFPSGHASFLFALAMITFYFSRRVGWWYFALGALNGLARIFVGVHWPLDIVGGAAVGILSGILIYRLTEPYLKKIHSKFSI